MKSRILTFVFLSSFIFQSKAELTYLVGRIPGYNNLDKKVYIDKSISVSYYNLIWEEELKSGLIQKDGTFRVIFDLPNTQDVYIKSGTGIYIVSLINPGDTIQLNLEYQLIQQKYQGYPSPFYMPKFESAFLGNYKEKQEKFFKFYYKWIIENRIADKIMSDNKGIQSQVNAIDQLLKSYFQEDVVDKDLYEWGYNYIFYSILARTIENGDSINLKGLKYLTNRRIASRRLSFALGTIGFKIEESFQKDYNNLITNKLKDAILSDLFIKLNNDEKQLIKTTNPEMYLSKKDSVVGKGISQKLKALQSFSNFADSLVFHTKADYYKNHLPQYFSDVLIAKNIILNSSDIVNSSLIVDEKIRDYIIKRIEIYTKKELYIKNYLFPENKLITGIIRQNKGKAIYIDIWATWCGACRSEFLNYPALINQYGDKIKFIFLCVSSPEADYLKVLKNLDFKAEHYFVTAKQYEELAVNYKVTSLPHYLFVRSNGTVINETIRPSDSRKLLELFDKK